MNTSFAIYLVGYFLAFGMLLPLSEVWEKKSNKSWAEFIQILGLSMLSWITVGILIGTYMKEDE